MRFLITLTLSLLMFAAVVPSLGNAQCIGTKDGGAPFPLGKKAPLPWDIMDGYWTDYTGQKFFYRIEVMEQFKDNSRTVSVSLMDETGTDIIGSGMGFVRSNSWDLWARVKGSEIDMKIRLQAFFPKNSTDMNSRALIATVKDMKASGPTCLVKHMLKKVDVLEDRSAPAKSCGTK